MNISTPEHAIETHLKSLAAASKLHPTADHVVHLQCLQGDDLLMPERSDVLLLEVRDTLMSEQQYGFSLEILHKLA